MPFCEFGLLGLVLFSLLKGERICNKYNVGSINISTELQSDILLPCYFETVLLRLDATADIAAVWTQKSGAIPNLLEITLLGEVRFWNNKSGCVRTFPNLSESGNFSILLLNVRKSDLGLYRCELFNRTNCSIAYQEMQLASDINHTETYWCYYLGAGVGFALLLAWWSFMKCKRSRGSVEPLYMNIHFHQDRRTPKEEDIYVNDTNLSMKSMKKPRKSHNPTLESPVYANCPRKSNKR